MNRSRNRDRDLFDPNTHSTDGNSDDDALRRIRAGDRALMAEYVMQRRSLLRRRIIRALGSASQMDLEADDLIAMLLIRLDRMVLRRSVRAATAAQLKALLTRTLSSVINDALRSKGTRRRTIESAVRLRVVRVSPVEDLGRGAQDDAGSLIQAGRALERFDDRVLFFLVSRGLPVRDAARAIGMRSGNARVRWGRIRAAIRRTAVLEEKKAQNKRIA